MAKGIFSFDCLKRNKRQDILSLFFNLISDLGHFSKFLRIRIGLQGVNLSFDNRIYVNDFWWITAKTLYYYIDHMKYDRLHQTATKLTIKVIINKRTLTEIKRDFIFDSFL